MLFHFSAQFITEVRAYSFLIINLYATHLKSTSTTWVCRFVSQCDDRIWENVAASITLN